MKPSWNDAPVWAQYLACNADGDWYWFECEPKQGLLEWTARMGKVVLAAENETPWTDTLEESPE